MVQLKELRPTRRVAHVPSAARVRRGTFGNDHLSGVVEVEETYIGGTDDGERSFAGRKGLVAGGEPSAHHRRHQRNRPHALDLPVA